MRRTVILLAALAVTAIAAYAQTEIQDRFLGLELGQTYSEMLEIGMELNGFTSSSSRDSGTSASEAGNGETSICTSAPAGYSTWSA